jgi:hypothetical protein
MQDIANEKTQIKICAFLITLLQGPIDTGISLVTNDAIVALMLQMAGSENHLHQVGNPLNEYTNLFSRLLLNLSSKRYVNTSVR